MLKNLCQYYLMVAIVLVGFLPTYLVAGVDNRIIDQVDDAREIKAFSVKPKGTWLPVPIPVSNPTIGSGLQAALLYLHPKEIEDSEVPNATSGIVGMYTDTESWLTGGFHDGNWKNDLYRFRIMLGTGEFNLDYFGIGNDSNLADNPIEYKISSDILFSQLLRRLPGTEDWYMGLRYLMTNAEVIFNLDSLVPGLPEFGDDMVTSSLGLMASYDSRDDNYYPTDGINFEFIWMRDSEQWGSDFEFDKLNVRYNIYLPLSLKDTLVFRADYALADEETPFYLLPTLKMRGFPNGRYKNESSLSGHTEWRRKFSARWGYVMFFEIGSTAASTGDLFEDETITSYGGGIRWQVKKEKSLNLGIDVGFSDDDSAVYVQVGEKF